MGIGIRLSKFVWKIFRRGLEIKGSSFFGMYGICRVEKIREIGGSLYKEWVRLFGFSVLLYS